MLLPDIFDKLCNNRFIYEQAYFEPHSHIRKHRFSHSYVDYLLCGSIMLAMELLLHKMHLCSKK